MNRGFTIGRGSLAVTAWLSAIACTEAPQEPVEYGAVAFVAAEQLGRAGRWSIRLTRADLVFGPAYFCAAASGSSTLCKSSMAELTSFAALDGLLGSAQALGEVTGFTGTIQSASYDYGITWFDTENEPAAAAAAPEGHSMRLEGEASTDDVVLPFTADVDVVPQYQGQTAVPTAPAAATIDSSDFRLEVHFRPADWFGQVDFDGLAGSGAERVVIAPGSPAHSALLVGIKNLAPPEFRWIRTNGE